MTVASVSLDDPTTAEREMDRAFAALMPDHLGLASPIG